MHSNKFITNKDLPISTISIRENGGANVGSRRRLNFIEGSNITLTIVDDPANQEIDITIAASGGGGSANVGTATLDFGAFPGKLDTSVAVTGQGGIVAGSIVSAWMRPVATADHSADEHMVEAIKLYAGNIIAGTGFTIYGFHSPILIDQGPAESALHSAAGAGTKRDVLGPNLGREKGAVVGYGLSNIKMASRIYGQYTVAWSWA